MENRNRTVSAEDTPVEQPPGVERTGYSGVGGWLALLCIELMVLVPIGTSISFAWTDWNDARGPDFLAALLALGYAIYGVYAGVRLLAYRPHAVRTAKRAVVVMGVLAVVALAFSQVSALILARAAFWSLTAAAWYLYLSRSRRVQDLYSSAPAPATRKGSPAATVVLAIAGCLTILGVVLPWFVGPMVLTVSNMEPTIYPNESFFVESLTYRFREPRAGDIILFKLDWDTRLQAKRVIAAGGQAVDIQDGLVLIDGSALDEQYTQGVTTTFPDGPSFPLTVPDGSVFVMGDNRPNSQDSRVYGPVPVSAIRGKVAR